MPTLMLKDADGKPVKQWELEDKPIVFGRGSAADVTIEDEKMSRKHFTIYKDGDHFAIRDEGSKNGTWVNREQIEVLPLNSGDNIHAGASRFTFHSGLGTMIAEMADGEDGYRTTLRKLKEDL